VNDGDNGRNSGGGTKEAQLEAIAEEVRALEASPLYDYRKENGYRPVIGEGDPDAEIMFIGEAPGQEEATTGRPFVGRAGRVLDALLASIDVDREDVYITNVIKDRPPGNRDPRVGEIELYAPFLLRQIEIIQPDVIATLGRFAMDFILERYDVPVRRQRIGDLHGEILEAEAPYGEVTVVPLYHPAAAFYNQALQETIEEDFQVLGRFV
jgi:DNA polymerase